MRAGEIDRRKLGLIRASQAEQERVRKPSFARNLWHVCPVCGVMMEMITAVHAEKHGMTKAELIAGSKAI